MKGYFEHTIDAKGRLFIPTKLRDGLGDRFVVTKGFDGCLSLYSQEKWQEMEQKIAALPMSQSRDIQRYFFANAMDCEPDAQGRVVIPAVLRDFAKITKEVAVVAVVGRVEVWDVKRWIEYSNAIDEADVMAAMENLQI